ncbi:YdeI/OmpD-associated family protein [Loigolactobacillus jiayinensis]|uniref:YdeI/OmpD-associated family protein n=1 Tax=Loigolactobacillus jiayinensis TaxID=2486016 RepID=A0ABW1RDT5_9LACO|nr:YdeI/OmpD-associated family protein [Loigolactobacillus jiayinensis]
MAEKKTLADYEVDIPKVSDLLNGTPVTKKFFDELTPGYQREWARYIFGAKAEATKQRHIADMRTILDAGYKSKRGYGQRSK